MTTSQEELHFLSLGIQYYVAARSAVLAGLVPASGSLFHHAAEMFLKARLSQKYTLTDLSQRPFGHKLPALWEAFKAEFPNLNLERFTETVNALDKFERLRYPDKIVLEGAAMSIGWGKGNAVSGPAAHSTPRYEIDVSDIDNLVAEIFEICSRNPMFFTGSMNTYARDAITRNNPAAERFVKPQS
jgi:hypothetical protein